MEVVITAQYAPFQYGLDINHTQVHHFQARGFCPQAGRSTKTSQTPILSPAFPDARIIFQRMQLFHIFTKGGSYLFPFAFVIPQSLLDLHGPVFYPIYSILIFIILDSLPPPPLQEGDLCHHWQAFVLKIFLLPCQRNGTQL